MSVGGKKPIPIPKGVTVKVSADAVEIQGQGETDAEAATGNRDGALRRQLHAKLVVQT